jgi:hypothetical protein
LKGAGAASAGPFSLSAGRPDVREAHVVRAVWDEDAGVFYSESDISGLHIEAETIEAFQDVLFELAPELIIANHPGPRR